MASTEKFAAVGLIALWSGMEASLFLGNPIIQYQGALRATRGESWTVETGLAASDATEDPGYHQLPAALGESPINEGDVVWIAGNRFVESYMEYIAAGGKDVLALGEWGFLGDGSAIRFGSALHFYRLSAAVAKAALGFYEPKLVATVHGHPSEGVFAGRQVYVGCVTSDVGERRLNDAFWFRQTNDYDGYDRAVIQAVMLADMDQGDIEAKVQKKSAFYENQFRYQLVEENEQLRAALARQPIGEQRVPATQAPSGVFVIPLVTTETGYITGYLTTDWASHPGGLTPHYSRDLSEMGIAKFVLSMERGLSHIFTTNENAIGKSPISIDDNSIDILGLLDNE